LRPSSRAAANAALDVSSSFSSSFFLSAAVSLPPTRLSRLLFDIIACSFKAANPAAVSSAVSSSFICCISWLCFAPALLFSAFTASSWARNASSLNVSRSADISVACTTACASVAAKTAAFSSIAVFVAAAKRSVLVSSASASAFAAVSASKTAAFNAASPASRTVSVSATATFACSTAAACLALASARSFNNSASFRDQDDGACAELSSAALPLDDTCCELPSFKEDEAARTSMTFASAAALAFFSFASSFFALFSCSSAVAAFFSAIACASEELRTMLWNALSCSVTVVSAHFASSSSFFKTEILSSAAVLSSTLLGIILSRLKAPPP